METISKIVIICGPTCSGKTAIAISLAKNLGGEIVSADSQQIYVGADIGTAKPGQSEMGGVAHHLIDIVPPSEQFSAAMFVKFADAAIGNIVHDKNIPFVVGGTGLYIKALCHGIMKSPEVDPKVRNRLLNLKNKMGLGHLYDILREKDRATAERVKPGDTQRIIRALEVIETSGRPISELRKEHGFCHKRYEYIKIGMDVDREELYERINKRVDLMIANGFETEVKEIVKKYGRDAPALKAVGYKEIAALDGAPLDNVTIELIKQKTRNYAKRQLTWFRADKEIKWFKKGKMKEMEELVRSFILPRYAEPPPRT